MKGDALNRGQSVVIGSMLMFGIGILLLGILQVHLIPQNNAEIELQHQSTVEGDFARFHSGLMNAVAENDEHTASFKLGVRYPNRLLFINPPDPQGSLRTAEVGPYDGTIPGDVDGDGNANNERISHVCGTEGDTTRALEYEPNYNELGGVGTHGYENTITYQSVNGDFISHREKLFEGNVIRLRPLVGESFELANSGTETVDFYAGTTGQTTFEEGDLELPTRLSQSQWQDIAAKNEEIAFKSHSGDTVTLELEEDFTLLCTPVGINSPPNNEPSDSYLVGEGPSEGNYDNPVGEGALQYIETQKSGNNNNNNNNNNNYYEAFWRSNDEPHTVVSVRVASVSTPGKSGETIVFERETEEVLTVGGSFVDVTWSWQSDFDTPPVKIKPNDGKSSITFNGNVQMTVQFELANEEDVRTYVIEIPVN